MQRTGGGVGDASALGSVLINRTNENRMKNRMKLEESHIQIT